MKCACRRFSISGSTGIGENALSCEICKLNIHTVHRNCDWVLTWMHLTKKLYMYTRTLFWSESKNSNSGNCQMKFTKPIGKHFFGLCLVIPVHSHLWDRFLESHTARQPDYSICIYYSTWLRHECTVCVHFPKFIGDKMFFMHSSWI